jgi:hypothetical protein
MHYLTYDDIKRKNRHDNLAVIKKTNPQALPPAGKNFYDFFQQEGIFECTNEWIDQKKITSPQSE